MGNKKILKLQSRVCKIGLSVTTSPGSTSRTRRYASARRCRHRHQDIRQHFTHTQARKRETVLALSQGSIDLSRVGRRIRQASHAYIRRHCLPACARYVAVWRGLGRERLAKKKIADH